MGDWTMDELAEGLEVIGHEFVLRKVRDEDGHAHWRLSRKLVLQDDVYEWQTWTIGYDYESDYDLEGAVAEMTGVMNDITRDGR